MPQYGSGTTVSVTNGSSTVTGTGTLFVANVTIGDIFIVNADGVSYVVASITSDTVLVLTANYAGTTNAAAAYAITIDFTPNFALPLLKKNDIETHVLVSRALTDIDTLLSARIGNFALTGDMSVSGVFTVSTNGQIDNSLTAGNTRLLIFDVNSDTLKRVTVGSNDSGGTGHKVLRIAN